MPVTATMPKVEVPNTFKVPDTLTLPVLSTANLPERLDVEVAINNPSARKLEVLTPSVTVTAVVNAVVPTPPVSSSPHSNLPVVALYARV